MRTRLTVLLGVSAIAGSYYFKLNSPGNPEPIQVLLLQDISRSTGPNGCPFLTEADFRELVRLFTHRQGELAFGVIGDKDHPLTRLLVPAADSLYGTGARARLFSSFRARVVELLELPPAGKTDLVSAMTRANTYFAESSKRSRFMVLVTDGIHDAGREVPPVPLDGVNVLVVAGRIRPRIEGARYYESISAAIQSIHEPQ